MTRPVTRGAAAHALLVLTVYLALLAATPLLLAWLTRHAPDLAIHWPQIDTDVFAPLVLVQLQQWWTQDTWPQLLLGFDDGDLILWMVVLTGWAGWIVLVCCTLYELAVCLVLGAAYAHQRLSGTGPRAWISGAVTTVLIGLAPGTATAAGPPRQPITATAPRHPGTAHGKPRDASAPERASLTAGGVADPRPPRRPDPFVLDADVSPDLPRYTVVPGDTLWDVARRYLGDPTRYHDIAGLNADRLPGGSTALRPGWVLLLPADATGLPEQGESLPPGTTWVTVARGDTLTSIAERYLGNRDAWTVLWQLNDHRRQPDGRVLRDPNRLLPGWRLAVPPSTPDTARTGGNPPPGTPPAQMQAPTPPGGQATPVSPPTTHSGRPGPSTTPPRAGVPDTGWVPLPSGGLAALGLAVAVAAAVEVLRRRRRHARDIPADADDGVGFVPRLPQALQTLHHAGHSTTRDPTRDGGEDDETGGQCLPMRPRWPPGPVMLTGHDPHGQPRQLDLGDVAGLGLTGPSAAGTVRAVLAAELLARYQHPTHVYVLDDAARLALTSTPRPGTPATDTRARLDSPDLEELSGVHLATSSAEREQLLAGLDTELTRRARLVTDIPTETVEHHAGRDPGWQALRRAHPDLHLPTIVVLATPTIGEQTSSMDGRVAAICTQGSSVGIHGLLLGPWPQEIDLDKHGTVTATAGPGADLLAGTRLPQLTPAEFHDILDLAHALRRPTESTQDPSGVDAHPATASTQPAPSPAETPGKAVDGMVGAAATVTAFPATDNPIHVGGPVAAEEHAATQAPAEVVDQGPVARLQLLGAMRLHTHGHDVTGLRSLSWELLAYLATHPDGASPGLLEEELLADRHSGNPRNLLQKAVSHARTRLREATGDHQAEFVTTRSGRYHIDHDHLACDVVELLNALHTARSSRDEHARHHARHQVASACQSGPPLPDADYHWAEETRQYLTSRVLPVLRDLATNLADTDPESALTVLETAITWEPYAESLYRHTITLHQHLGHPEAAHATYRLLGTRLTDIDRTPEDTIRTLVTGKPPSNLLENSHKPW